MSKHEVNVFCVYVVILAVVDELILLCFDLKFRCKLDKWKFEFENFC